MPEPRTKKPAPYNWQRHWTKEIDAAEKATEAWRSQAEKVLRRYRDERDDVALRDNHQLARWNYFWAQQQTRLSMLFGQTPHTSVDRRYADADDDEARVAGEMLDRLLNGDLQDPEDGALAALRHALFDAELVDLGIARVRYDMEEEPQKSGPDDEETEAAAEGEDSEPLTEVVDEKACIEWCHWRDFYWSAGAKVWSQVRWVAYGCEMPREELVRRFGEAGKMVPLNAPKSKDTSDGEKDVDPRKRAYVYEIWSKEHGKCFWYVKGMSQILEGPKDPPLRLRGFFSCPEPMVQNATTSALLPKPTYAIVQDLYTELDSIAARTRLLQDAIAVRGVYDGNNEGLKQLLSDAGRNELVPVDSWAMYAEKGGMKGSIDWLPLEMIVNALVALQERAALVKANLQEITGHSDVLRGEALDAGTTATDARRATRMASTRLQAAQDRFARFCSDLMRLKAEVMCALFSPERLVERSNILRTADGQNPQLIQGAVQLLKSGVSDYRIEIRPESVALEDFSAQKAEAVEVLGAIGQFLDIGAKVVQGLGPSAAPLVLKLLQGSLSKVRGARWAEGILDPAIAQAEQAAQQPPGQQGPSPEQMKMQAIQAKAQADLQREDAKLRADLIKTQAEVQAQAQIQQQQTEANLAEEAGRLRLKAAADAQKALTQPAQGNGVAK